MIGNSIHLANSTNRDEYLLVEYNIFFPLCDEIIFSILGSNMEKYFPVIKNMTSFNPDMLYRKYGLYDKYRLYEELSVEPITSPGVLEEFEKLVNASSPYINYRETAMRHTIIELANAKFMKKIVIVYNREITIMDHMQMARIVPEELLPKFELVTGNILDLLIENHELPFNSFAYTTLYTTKISNVHEIIDNPDKYNAKRLYIILQNSTDNAIIEKTSDGAKLILKGSEDIFNKLYDHKKNFPKGTIGFSRFTPVLFSDHYKTLE